MTPLWIVFNSDQFIEPTFGYLNRYCYIKLQSLYQVIADVAWRTLQNLSNSNNYTDTLSP